MTTNEERYEPGELVWARADEGSLGQIIIDRDDRDDSGLIYGQSADAVEMHQKAIDVARAADAPAPPPPAVLCFNTRQVARSRDRLEEHEPPLEDSELEELINEATNALALETSELLIKYEQYANRRWGQASLRATIACAAAFGAVKGTVEGELLILAPPPEILGIVDSTARTVALHLAREAHRDEGASRIILTKSSRDDRS